MFKGRNLLIATKHEKELQEFAANSSFPSHGLILRKSKEDLGDIVKGITDEEQLNKVFYTLITNYGTAYVETYRIAKSAMPFSYSLNFDLKLFVPKM